MPALIIITGLPGMGSSALSHRLRDLYAARLLPPDAPDEAFEEARTQNVHVIIDGLPGGDALSALISRCRTHPAAHVIHLDSDPDASEVQQIARGVSPEQARAATQDAQDRLTHLSTLPRTVIRGGVNAEWAFTYARRALAHALDLHTRSVN